VLEARLGFPRAQIPQPDGTIALRWIGRGTNVELPSGSFDLEVTPTSFDLRAEARPGSIEHVEYEIASAVIDSSGTILRLDDVRLRAGIPDGLNLRTGLVMGLSGGAGRLDDAASPMPSLGLYIGGMIGPRLALVGAYAFVNGKGDGGYAMGHSWALAAQYWPAARVALRAGPAMVLALEPGLRDPSLSPGAVGAASFALVRAGSFVLDLRLDATVSTAAAFGTLGIGVNVN
jgi:hypothetical protein